VRIALACLLLAGCDRLFYLDRLPDVEIDASTISDGAVDMAVDASPLVCPGDFTFLPETRTYYRVIQQPTMWPVARELCKTIQNNSNGYTHLIVINSQFEYDLVFAMPEVQAQTPWSGAFDNTPTDHASNFVWVTNEMPTYLNWGTDAWPDGPDSQNCARMAVPNGMDDETCSEMKWFVCECDRYQDF
jgi:lectin-like protein